MKLPDRLPEPNEYGCYYIGGRGTQAQAVIMPITGHAHQSGQFWAGLDGDVLFDDKNEFRAFPNPQTALTALRIRVRNRRTK